jgi:hypothetical protein
MGALATLAFHLACREPLTSEPRKVFDRMQTTYDVIVNGRHIRDVDPLPPVAAVVTPVQTDTPAAPPLELRVEPIEEDGRVKAVEVYARGSLGASFAAKPEIDFWLWDETAGDEPFLVSGGDIDHVHERAVHHHAWKSDEYDPSKWQTAGVIRFNRFMPPSGGNRRISVGGRIQTKMLAGILHSMQSARSKPVAMNIAVSGYHAVRKARHVLRYRAFVLAVGLALLSGKGLTYRQDKALEKFAKLLCAGIKDRKVAEAYQNDLLTLIDSNVAYSHDELIRQLPQLSSQAYPELRSQLLAAFVEIMASRRVRTKESREFLKYSKDVLS